MRAPLPRLGAMESSPCADGCGTAHRVRAGIAWSANTVSNVRNAYWDLVFAVQSVAASSIGLVVLITWWRTKVAPSRFEGVWLVAMGVGLVAIAVSAAPGHATRTGNVFRLSMWILVVVVAWEIGRAHV